MPYIAALLMVLLIIPPSQYSDMGAISQHRIGAMKNGTSAVVAGIIGQKIYGHSEVELEIEKMFWPDAPLQGVTTPDEIQTEVELPLSHSEFRAMKDNDDLLIGEVEKGQLNWEVLQVSENQYLIRRWGIKLDMEISLEVGDGNVKGKVERGLPMLGDWLISGTYDELGNVDLKIGNFMGVRLVGRILQK